MLLQPLAQLRRQQGNREAALKLLRRLYQAERASDPRSPAAEGAATDLARALQELGEYDEARALLDEKLSLLSVCTLFITPHYGMLPHNASVWACFFAYWPAGMTRPHPM